MTDDEMDRKMEFIVEQQAQFAVDIQLLKERQIAFQHEQERLHRDVRRLHEDVTASRLDATVLHESASTALEIASRAADTVTKLVEAQTKTDRQLRRLARLFEVHVRDGHSHDSPTS